MREELSIKIRNANFLASFKCFIAVCFALAIVFYMFLYVFVKPDFAKAEQTYNYLKEIAYAEAEKKNTDYEINDVLLKYEISTMEDGFKHVILVGKDNVNLKFYLSADYDVIETVESWKISTATTIFAQILTSILLGLSGGIIIYFTLGGVDILLTSVGAYNRSKKQ